MTPETELEQASKPEADSRAVPTVVGEIRGWARDVFFAIGTAILIVVFLYQPVKVEGTSMLPELFDQERIFVNKFVYRIERIARKDIVVFFIFIVSNCGGLLTPLGDPPLFLGFLKGVPFEWTIRLWPQWATVNGMLLVIFFMPTQFALDLQLLGGVWMVQIFPALIFGLFTRWFSGWAPTASPSWWSTATATSRSICSWDRRRSRRGPRSGSAHPFSTIARKADEPLCRSRRRSGASRR